MGICGDETFMVLFLFFQGAYGDEKIAGFPWRCI